MTSVSKVMREQREYQTRDVKNILKSLKKNKGTMYQLPTGGGKSVVMADVIEKVNGVNSVLFLVHRRELVFQMSERLKEAGHNVGVLIGEIEENTSSNLLIASIATVVRDKRLATVLNRKFDYVFVDGTYITYPKL